MEICLVKLLKIVACVLLHFPFRILDDMEMYEQQDPFKLNDFVTISYFLNQFLYKAVLNNLFGAYYSFYTTSFLNVFEIVIILLYTVVSDKWFSYVLKF